MRGGGVRFIEMNHPKHESLWFKIARHSDVSNVMQTSKIRLSYF